MNHGEQPKIEGLAGKDEAADDKALSFAELSERGLISPEGCDRLHKLGQELQNSEFDFLRELKKKFGQGIDICLVGGIVRDSVLGKPAKDYDFIVSFSDKVFSGHEQARQAFEDFFKPEIVQEDGEEVKKYPFGRLKLVGENFGVYKLRAGGSAGTLDIAFPRLEQAKDNDRRGGRANFDVQSNALMPVSEDLKRRDLDINAMAVRVESLDGDKPVLKFIDRHGGLDSLKQKKIKAVGNPEARFSDDLSRIFRAIRFACKFDFDIEDGTWRAIEKIVSQDLINAKNREGKFLIAREIIAAEICRAFSHNPLKCFDLLTAPLAAGPEKTTSLLEQIEPELFNEIRLKKEDLKYLHLSKKQWYQENFGQKDKSGASQATEPSPRELEASHLIKQRALARAKEMLASTEDNGNQKSLEEIFAIIFHNSGQTEKLTAKQPRNSRSIFPGHSVLSSAYWHKFYDQLRLAALPLELSGYLVDKKDVDRIILGIHKIYGLLNDAAWKAGKIKPKLADKIFKLLPAGMNDKLFKVLQADILATDEVTAGTRRRFESLKEFLLEDKHKLEDKYGAVETLWRENFSAKDLRDIFKIETGPLFQELERLAKINFISYLREINQNGEEFSAAKAKAGIFNVIASHEQVRRQWKKFITADLYPAFFDDSDNGTAEEKKRREKEVAREILAAVEISLNRRYVGSDFTGIQEKINGTANGRGKIFGGLLLKRLMDDPEKFERIFQNHIGKQGKGKILEDGEIVSLKNKPVKDNKLKPKLFDILLPEVADLYKVEQPSKYHQEGDVLTHTFLALKAMKKMADEGWFKADEELALTILAHDTGKPGKMTVNEKTGAILFADHEGEGAKMLPRVISGLNLKLTDAEMNNIKRVIENHGKMYAKWQNKKPGGEKDEALDFETYRLFPGGSKDLLYKLIFCDAKASVRANGVDGYDEFKSDFEKLKRDLEKIDDLSKMNFSYDDFLADKEINCLIGDLTNSARNFAIYKEYHDFAIREKERLGGGIGKFIRQKIASAPEIANTYFKNKFDLISLAAAFIGGNDKSKDLSQKELKARNSEARSLVKNFLDSNRFEFRPDLSETLNIKQDFQKWLEERGPGKL